MLRYTLTVFKSDGPIMAVNLVLGCETRGDTLYFWFDKSRIMTAIRLKVGEHFSLTRDE